MTEATVAKVPLEQAIALSLLVDLEARWENLRKTPLAEPDAKSATHDLQGKQKAYEGFHAKLLSYNRRYAPAHVPELLLNTPSRLGLWCQRMRDLYLQVEHQPEGHCPVYLLDKACRWADLICARMHLERFRRSEAPGTIAAAIRELEALGQWCDNAARSLVV
jgi:hypothetical protein